MFAKENVSSIKLCTIYDKVIRKAIMRRSELESKYLKNRTIGNKLNISNKSFFVLNFIKQNEKILFTLRIK